nr:AMP-binding protein [Tatlockia sp.]
MIRKLRKEDANTLVAMFNQQVAKNPPNPAVVFGKQCLSYEELNNKSNQLAHYLIGYGLKADRSIALIMDRSIELLIVILGILKAGGAYVPLDTTCPQE